jgi:hypothetical protein
VAGALVGSGVALADVVSFARFTPLNESGLLLETSDFSLQIALSALGSVDDVPLSVRDAVGWALVYGGHDDGIKDLVSEWASVGLAERGWLFAAAGYKPGEAGDLVAAAPVDEGGLWALAALRGSLVPAG